MGKPLALSNGTVLRTSAGARLGRTPPSARTWRLANSFKGAWGLELTNVLLRFPEPFQDIVDGSTVIYRPMELEDQGHIGRGGEIVSMPADAAIDAVRLYANMTVASSGMWEQPDAYNGRTIVFKVASGTIGDGNTLGFQNFGSSTVTHVNTTGAAYRVELEIDDVASWGQLGLIMRINFGGTADQQSRLDQLALLSNVKLAAFFKDEEALYDDIPNNLWKAWSPAWLAKKDPWDILRFMDFTGQMTFTPTHCKDFSQPDDAHWGNFGGTSYSVQTLTGGAHSRRQGYPIEALLNLCENGSPSGNPWTAWFNVPAFANSPVRKNMTSYQLGSATYREDGVTQTYNQSDSVFWFDPAWVDLSTLVLTGGPTHGEVISVDTTTGKVVYNPESGGDPWTHTSGEGQEELTFTFDRINYDASNNPSVGPQVSFTVPIRVLWSPNQSVHYCRMKGAQMWPLNQAYFEDANRWQSQARSLVDAIVASGYSTTRPIYIEVGNEPWNSGVFELDRLFCQGVAETYGAEWDAWQATNSKDNVTQSMGGAGIVSTYYQFYVDAELASRSLSYNLKFIVGSWTAVPDYSKAATQGHLFALDDIFGYTAQEQADAMAEFYCAGTSYTQGALRGDGNNITGERDGVKKTDGDGATTQFAVTNVTGTRAEYRGAKVGGVDQTEGVDFTINDDGTDITFTFTSAPPVGDENVEVFARRHSQEVLDRFDGTEPGYNADSSTLTAEIVAYMTGAASGNPNNNNAGVVSLHASHIANCAAEGGNWFGEYEGGDHATGDHIAATMRNSARTNSAGKTFKEWYEEDFQRGPDRAVIVADMYDRLIAQKPDTVIAQYGDDTRRSINQPWAQGIPTLDPKYPDIQKIIDDYGRL